MTLGQLKNATQQLTAHAFHLGTTQIHLYQASSFIKFCNYYDLLVILPSTAKLCYYITHLTHHFQSARTIGNYISRVRFLHNMLSLTTDAIDSFLVTSFLQVANITMRTPTL